MSRVDLLDKVFIGWAFAFQLILIAHFALRQRFFETYTLRFGWIVYALALPALVISVILLKAGKSWSFWLGGFIFFIFASFGYWIDYVKGVPWRSPLNRSVMFPYVFLYLGTVMFYWWPLGQLSKPLWYLYAVLFVIATILNLTSH